MIPPLLPTHALPFFGPDPVGNWGGVPWNQATVKPPGMWLPTAQQPWQGNLAVFPLDGVVIVSGTVDDDTDGPGGSVVIDPCYQPETSLRWPDGSSIDSRQFRGMVMHAVIEKRGGRLGDLGAVCHGGVIHFVQYYDDGPDKKLQEGAEKILRDTGVIDPGQSSRHAAVYGNDVQDFCALIFCGSAPRDSRGRPYALPQDEIIARGWALWNAFTGRAAISEGKAAVASGGTAAAALLAVPLTLAAGILGLPLLAEANLSAQTLEWIGGFVGFLAIVKLGMGIAVDTKKLRAAEGQPMPQPLVVRAADQFVTAEQIVKIEQDLRNQMKDLRTYVHEAVHSIAKSVQVIQTGQADQAEGMRELFAELDARNEARVEKVHNRVNEVISKMPGELISLLRNTGVIKS